MKPLRECFEGILRFDLSVGFRELQSRSNTAGYLAERKAFFTRAKPSVPSCPPTLSRSQKHTGTHAHFKFPLHSESLSLTHLFTHSPVLLPRERTICPVLLSCFSSFTNFLRLNISLTLFLLTSGWSTNQTLWSYVQSLQAVTHSLSLRSSLSLSLSLCGSLSFLSLACMGKKAHAGTRAQDPGPGPSTRGMYARVAAPMQAAAASGAASRGRAWVRLTHARVGRSYFRRPVRVRVCPSAPSTPSSAVGGQGLSGGPLGGGKKCNSTSYDQTSAVK